MEEISRMDKNIRNPPFASKIDFSLSKTNFTPFLEDSAKSPTFASPRCSNFAAINTH